MGWFGSSNEPEVPNTVSDGKWWRVRKAAAGEVPLIDGPWVDPKAAAKKRAWNDARDNAVSN